MTYSNSSTLLHGKSLKWKLIINFNYFSYIHFSFRCKWQSLFCCCNYYLCCCSNNPESEEQLKK